MIQSLTNSNFRLSNKIVIDLTKVNFLGGYNEQRVIRKDTNKRVYFK